MICVFDTETTGFARSGLLNDPSQPHLVQLAAALYTDDGQQKAVLDCIVQCPIEVPEGAAKVHGITREISMQQGIPVAYAMSALQAFLGQCNTLVAHNIEFDAKIIDIAFARLGKERNVGYREVCTKGLGAKVCNIPPTEVMVRAGRNYPKSPNLMELHTHLFGTDLTKHIAPALIETPLRDAISN